VRVWGLCPKHGPGAEPLVRSLGTKRTEAESFMLHIARPDAVFPQ